VSTGYRFSIDSQSTTVVHPEVVKRLKCPACGKSVGVVGGGVRCASDHFTAYRDGYLHALIERGDTATDRTFKSFGYEWTTFGAVTPEDEAFWTMYFRDVPLDQLRGRVGLDAGCGKARFSRLTARHLQALVALDGSSAVEAAAANLAGTDNVVVVQADLREAPFEEASFGFICSLGVLHHLVDPEDGLRSLVRLLAPGGLLLLYLYSRPEAAGLRHWGLAAASALRRFTPRVPHPVLRIVCMPVSVALYALVVVPGSMGSSLGIRPLTRLPLDTYRHRPVRSLWLDTFDRLSAPVEHRYVWDELAAWFERANLEVVAVRHEAGFHVLCRLPGPKADA